MAETVGGLHSRLEIVASNSGIGAANSIFWVFLECTLCMKRCRQKTSVLPAASPGSLAAAGRSGPVLHLSAYDEHRGQHPGSGPYGSESRSCSSDPLRFAVGTWKVRPVIPMSVAVSVGFKELDAEAG